MHSSVFWASHYLNVGFASLSSFFIQLYNLSLELHPLIENYLIIPLVTLKCNKFQEFKTYVTASLFIALRPSLLSYLIIEFCYYEIIFQLINYQSFSQETEYLLPIISFHNNFSFSRKIWLRVFFSHWEKISQKEN